MSKLAATNTKVFRLTLSDDGFSLGDMIRFTKLSNSEIDCKVTVMVNGACVIVGHGKFKVDYKPVGGDWRYFTDIDVNESTPVDFFNDVKSGYSRSGISRPSIYERYE